MNSGLNDFFATPRKAKDPSIKKDNPEKPEIEISEKKELLKKDIDKATNDQTALVSKRDNYKATPKIKLKRKFDTFVKKSIQVNEEDLIFLNKLESSISFARKRAKINTVGLNRVTTNTILRLLIENFCSDATRAIEMANHSFENLQTEEEIKNWIKNL